MSSAPMKLEDVSKFSKRSILLGHYQFSKYLQPHIGYIWRNKDYISFRKINHFVF